MNNERYLNILRLLRERIRLNRPSDVLEFLNRNQTKVLSYGRRFVSLDNVNAASKEALPVVTKDGFQNLYTNSGKSILILSK